MNAKRILYLGMLCLMAIMTSCSNDDEPKNPLDMSPVPVIFQILTVDEAGNNLLTGENIASAKENITIEYNGDTYKIDASNSPAKTFKSSKLENGSYLLYFGTFFGNYNAETFVINYGNGNSHIVSFTVKNYADVTKTEYLLELNGVPQPNIGGPSFILRLNPNK